jgi:hypothetical protein
MNPRGTIGCKRYTQRLYLIFISGIKLTILPGKRLTCLLFVDTKTAGRLPGCFSMKLVKVISSMFSQS